MKEQDISASSEIIEIIDSVLEEIDDFREFVEIIREWFSEGVPNELLSSNDSDTDRRENRKRKEKI